ncbi:MAG TPA: hypothetical protein H9815_06205 [Candidatus Ruania gallistercoris]|uniref:Integrase catalytic domain-containing protein n=1 Tax=Candidatus Ruania gallistercoris TaxID=2838746 RepID=A0A9D2EDF6_9MICO|nr:hypothetical protein [Candidatus Ruania gallistercoris]
MTAQPPAHDTTALQHQLNSFQTWYNTQRPYRALNRRTPAEAYAQTPKARPAPHSRSGGCTIRTDRVDQDGEGLPSPRRQDAPFRHRSRPQRTTRPPPHRPRRRPRRRPQHRHHPRRAHHRPHPRLPGKKKDPGKNRGPTS